MTPAQRALLEGLSRDELLAVLEELVGPRADDHRVALAAMRAIGHRIERLARVAEAAGDVEGVTLAAWMKRHSSDRLYREYRRARTACRRAEAALQRAHEEYSRLFALPIPLPAPEDVAT